MKTGFTASKLAIAAFIVPYIFVMNPTMLFVNAHLSDIIIISITALLGITSVSVGVVGYLRMKMHPLLRVLAVVMGLAMLYPGIYSDLIGMLFFAGIFAYQSYGAKKREQQMR